MKTSQPYLYWYCISHCARYLESGSQFGGNIFSHLNMIKIAVYILMYKLLKWVRMHVETVELFSLQNTRLLIDMLSLWFCGPWVEGKSSRRSAADIRYRQISREVPPSSNCWSDLRIRITSTAKVMSSTGTNVGEARCDEEYIEGNFQNPGERYKEHQKEPSPIHV